MIHFHGGKHKILVNVRIYNALGIQISIGVDDVTLGFRQSICSAISVGNHNALKKAHTGASSEQTRSLHGGPRPQSRNLADLTSWNESSDRAVL